MKIILLDSIEKLGDIGSEVVVKSGYARNFLIPKSKAILSTKKNLEIFQEKQFKLKSQVIERQNKAKICAETINQLGSITIKARSNIDGKLFGSIGPRDIANIITESVCFKVSKSQIRLPNDDILKSIGIYNVKVHIYGEITASVNVKILNVLTQNIDINN